jgi:hypothetical protein
MKINCLLILLTLLSGCANLEPKQWASLGLSVATFPLNPLDTVNQVSTALDVAEAAAQSSDNYQAAQQPKPAWQLHLKGKNYDENGGWVYVPYDEKRNNSGI